MSKLNWTLSAALLAAACVMTAPPARAQSTLGTFNLPVQARFGGTVLQPGEYSVSRVNGMNAIQIKGDGGVATMLASSAGPQANNEHSKLTLTSVDGVFSLKRFESGSLGMTFDFRVPKTDSREADRASIGQPGTLDIALK